MLTNRSHGRLGILVGLVVACAGLAGPQAKDASVEVLPVVGPHGVGRVSFRWVDAARPEPLTPDPADHRNVVVHVWYPTEPGTAAASATYVPDASTLRRVLPGPEFAAWQRVEPHAREHAPLVPGKPLPVVVFSPGNRMLSALYSYLLEGIASAGYVVVGIDHPFDVRAVVLKDQSIAEFAEHAWPSAERAVGAVPDPRSPHALAYRERVAVRVADIQFVLAQLASGAELGPLQGRVDVARVAIVGHSIGGVAAGEVCRLDGRVTGCLNVDGSTVEGPFYLDEARWRSQGAYLMLTKPFQPSDELLAAWKVSRPDWERRRAANDRRYYTAPNGGGYRIVLTGASHETFSDDPIVIAALRHPDKVAASRSVATTVRSVALAFLQGVLRDGDWQSFRDTTATGAGVRLERWDPSSR